MIDNTFNKSKDNINKKSDSYSNNNTNNNYNSSANINRFQSNIINKPSLTPNSSNASTGANRFESNVIIKPNQQLKNGYTPPINNRFQNNVINKSVSLPKNDIVSLTLNRNNLPPFNNPIPTNFNKPNLPLFKNAIPSNFNKTNLPPFKSSIPTSFNKPNLSPINKNVPLNLNKTLPPNYRNGLPNISRPLPPNFNRPSLNPNNINNSQSNIRQNNLNQNNINIQPNFNRANLNPSQNNINAQPNFNRTNLNLNNINNLQPNPSLNNLNPNQNNINGQSNFDPNNLNQNPNNINGQPNFDPNIFNPNLNNINGQSNFDPNFLNQNLNNFNGQQNFDPNTNNFNGQPNFDPNNQNPNNINGQPNFDPNNQNPNNINGQPNFDPNNLNQNPNNINNQPNIDASNLNQNNTPIVEKPTTPSDVASSQKDANLNNVPVTGTDVSLNKKPLETDIVKSTYNPYSKKRISIIALTSILVAGALISAIALPIVLIGPNIQNTTQQITATIVYDLDIKSVKLVVEGAKLLPDKNLYSVSRETPTKIFEPIDQNSITLVPVGNSEIDLDFTDTNFTIYSVYKVKINDGSANGIEVTSVPTENIKMPKLSIISQSQNQTLFTSTSTITTTLSVAANVATNPIANQGISYQWKSSDVDSANEADWTPIANETKSTYIYDATALPIGVKKYFKCTLNYKYANSITSTPIYIEKVDQPVIVINQQPNNVDLNFTNGTATLSVGASVSMQQTLSYQWQSSNTNNGTFVAIEGANLNSYSLSNVDFGFRKYYRCIVSSPNATPIISSVVYISRVSQPIISISQHPTNVNLSYTDTSATLRVNASVTSSLPLVYQWQQSDTANNGYTNINGANSSTYVFNNASSMAPGATKYFKCIVSSINATSVTSNSAYITRSTQPTITITAQPSDVNLTLSETSASISVSATTTNQQALTYQWQSSDNQNGAFTPVTNANSNIYSLNNIAFGFRKYYKCIISSANANSVESNTVFISKVGQPIISINTHPSNVDLAFTATYASFSVNASVSVQQALTYQWQSSTNQTTGFVDIAGATSTTYTLNNSDISSITPGVKRYYKCIVSSVNATTMTSNVAYILRALQPTISVSNHPVNVDLSVLQTNATLTVNASVINGTNGQGVTYQWQSSDSETSGFSNIAGANLNTYSLSNVDYGFRKYYKCMISSANATPVYSNVAHITRVAQPRIVINTQPSDVSLPFETTSTTLSISASVENGTGGQALSYQWQSSTNQDSGFININGQTSSTYTISDISSISPGSRKYYKCILTSPNATTLHSRVAYVARGPQLNSSISITTQPLQQTLTSASNSFSLSVVASITNPITGRPTPTYKWSSADSQNGNYLPVSNATSSTYTHNLDASTKKGWRDTWYKCDVTYTGAAIPTVTTTPVSVRMTLTEAEARSEFINWSNIQVNVESVLRKYFNETSSSETSKFYSTPQVREFVSVPSSVEFVSAIPQQITVQGAPTFTSYKVRLKTKSTSSYRTRTGSNNAQIMQLPVGGFIEFVTLFSFAGDSQAVMNLSGAPNYNITFTTSFTSSNGSNSSRISWVGSGTPPSISSSLRSSAYPMNVYDVNGSAIFADYLVSSHLPTFASSIYTTLPTYNIRYNY